MNNQLLRRSHKYYVIVLLALITIAINACKEKTVLPSDLVPDVDNINTFQSDTFTVVSKTVIQDSLLTGGFLKNTSRSADPEFYHAIGYISDDPVFGKTIGSSYLQFVQPAPQFAFTGTNQTIDSVVISLNYIDAFGDTNTSPNQTFSLYHVSENLTKDSAYYEFSPVSFLPADLAKTISVNMNTLSKDSVIVGGVKLRPQLRFKLPTDFADSLLSQTSTGAFNDYTSFLTWLGGFYITPDLSSGNTMGYFDTYNSILSVYYRYTNTSSQPDTSVALFRFNPSYCNRFNHIERDYTGYAPASYLSSSNTLGDSLVFIQREPGLVTEISFPYLHQFPNAIINKAELVMNVVSPITNFSDTTHFNIPNQLQVLFINENGEEEILQDYVVFGLNWVGGYRKPFTLNSDNSIQYKFNVSGTIQNAVSTQMKNFKFKIAGSRSGFPAKDRVVVVGGSSLNPLEKMKLNIIFTKIQ